MKRKLAKVQRRKMKLIYQNLASFTEKHDYWRKEAFTQDEIFSLQLAVEVLKGRPIITNYTHISSILKPKQEGSVFSNIAKKLGKRSEA